MEGQPVEEPGPQDDADDEAPPSRRRGLEVWAVEQIVSASEAPPIAQPDATSESESEASTSSAVFSRRSSLSSAGSSIDSEEDGSFDAGSRRSSISSDGYASDASSGYASDASSGGYTSDASGGYASDGYASSEDGTGGGTPHPRRERRHSGGSIVCRAHPLHHAAASCDGDAVSQLLEEGEDPNGLDKHGCTPLHRAAHGGDVAITRRILDAQADVAATTEHGHTALHRACMRGQSAVVGELLAAGADHSVKARRGYTALHYAARAGYASSALLLLEAKADPDVRDGAADEEDDTEAMSLAGGNAPMHKACQHGRGEAVYTLLGYNARPELRNAMGRTPRQVAQEHGEEETVRPAPPLLVWSAGSELVPAVLSGGGDRRLRALGAAARTLAAARVCRAAAQPAREHRHCSTAPHRAERGPGAACWRGVHRAADDRPPAGGAAAADAAALGDAARRARAGAGAGARAGRRRIGCPVRCLRAAARPVPCA